MFGDYLKADDDLADLLLQDMFRGGYMGSKEMDERYISSMAYNRTMLMKNKSKIQYIVYMLCWKVKSGAKRVFPDYSRMIKLYPSVKRIPVVLPFAWMIHSIKYIKQKIDSGILKKEIQPDDDVKNTIAASRIRLFKSLNMI